MNHGADIGKLSEGGYAPIHVAAYFGHTKIVELLLDRGADIDGLTAGDECYTPIHLAIDEDRPKTVKLLLKRGANIKILNWVGYAPIHTAIKFGYTEIVELLLNHDADTEILTKDGEAAIHLAVDDDDDDDVIDVDVIKTLLNHGANVDSLSRSGKSALLFAVKKRSMKIIEILLAKNATIDFNVVKSIFEGEFEEGAEIIIEHYFKHLNPQLVYRTFINHCKKYFVNINPVNRDKAVKWIQLLYKLHLKKLIIEAQNIEDIKLARKTAENTMPTNLRPIVLTPAFKKKVNSELLYLANKVNVNNIINNNNLFQIKRHIASGNQCRVCDGEDRDIFRCLANNPDCNNSACLDCINEQLEIWIKNKCQLPVCSNGGCGRAVKPDILNDVGCDKSKTDYLKHNIAKLRIIQNDPNLKQCWSAECTFTKLINPGEPNFIECPLCGFTGCLQCGSDHRGECKSVKNDQEKWLRIYTLGKNEPPAKSYSDYNEIDDEYLNGRYRLCPYCGVSIERSDGCNRVQCTNCNQTFHWNKGPMKEVPHDFDKGKMEYEEHLRERGYLDQFNIHRREVLEQDENEENPKKRFRDMIDDY